MLAASTEDLDTVICSTVVRNLEVCQEVRLWWLGVEQGVVSVEDTEQLIL